MMKIFLLILLLEACTGAPTDDGITPPPLYLVSKSIEAKPRGGYTYNTVTNRALQPLINSSGKRLITGEPIPAKGKPIHPDSVAKPKIVKVGANPKQIKAHTNVYAIPENLIEIPVNESRLKKHTAKNSESDFIIINSDGDTIPTGVSILAKGRTVTSLFPKIKPALPLRMKDNALYDIQYLDVDQGMNSSFVRSMLEDKAGNIWFGTEGGGVSRYDGRSFVHFSEDEGISNNTINSIIEDKSGNLWFGTDGGGVSKYDGKSFVHFTETEGLSNNSIWSILEDRNGNLWFGTGSVGVSKYDGKSFVHFTTAEGLSNNIVNSILEDKSGNLWFGTAGGGVNKYDGKSFVHFTTNEGLSNNTINSILEDKSGNIWFGTEGGGVSRYDGKSFAHFTETGGLSSNNVSSILMDKSGNLWFGTYGGGVSKFDGKFFVHFTTAEGLSNNSVNFILEDRSGNLWFGTDGGGVSNYKGNSFVHFTKTDGLSDNFVRSMLEDSSGNLWFGTFSGGISKYDGKSFVHFTTAEGLSNNNVRSLMEDKSGVIWFGTGGGGVSRFNGKTLLNFNEAGGLSNNNVRCMLEDKSGNLWFGTGSGGVSKFDGKSFSHFTITEGLSNNRVRSMLEDKSGNLWFGTGGGGVSKYDGKSFIHFTEAEGLSDNSIWSILEDKAGNIWFGTQDGGVSKYDGKSFTHFTEAEGLSNNTIWSIVEDKAGNLWFGTQGGGVSRYDGKFFVHFTKADGLSDNNVTSILEDKAGNLWFGTYGGGVSRYNGNAYIPAQNAPAVYLRQLMINEELPDYRNLSKSAAKKIKFDSVHEFENYPLNLRLPYYKKHLSFNFSAIDWGAPNKIRYSYRMLGLNENWSAPTAEGYTDYRNMSDGTFTFQIRAIGESGVWSKPFEYTFTILPPWWKTWLAYLLYTLIFLGALMIFSKSRERKLRYEKEILQIKVEERTRELKKSLEDLKSTQSQLIHSEKMASLGELTAGIAHEIQNPLNFVNNFSEVSSELVDDLGMEMEKGNFADAKEIANDLKQNLEKINTHGKRAGDIVKGMLQHSRTSTGKKELTELNKLADEYLRLAYHGLRAKDKSFNATMKTEFDENIGIINIIPQDIGRVILNLINNAFYAAPLPTEGGGKNPQHKHEPTVWVTTKKVGDRVLISVRDNGPGIPKKIVDKIFQPFFTTKPAGQGTGLGLSLSYDIVKAHGGELKVETKEGEGSEFIISLPVN